MHGSEALATAFVSDTGQVDNNIGPGNGPGNRINIAHIDLNRLDLAHLSKRTHMAGKVGSPDANTDAKPFSCQLLHELSANKSRTTNYGYELLVWCVHFLGRAPDGCVSQQN